MTAEEVRSEIDSAWAGLEPPAAGEVAYDESGRHLECAAVARYFLGKKWQEVTLEALRTGYPGDESACLYFMSPVAFRYYLPSFMCIAMHEPQQAFIAEEAAVSALTPTSNPTLEVSQAARFCLFSSPQRGAIRSFLDWAVEYRGKDCGLHDPRVACEHWRHVG